MCVTSSRTIPSQNMVHIRLQQVLGNSRGNVGRLCCITGRLLRSARPFLTVPLIWKSSKGAAGCSGDLSVPHRCQPESPCICRSSQKSGLYSQRFREHPRNNRSSLHCSKLMPGFPGAYGNLACCPRTMIGQTMVNK